MNSNSDALSYTRRLFEDATLAAGLGPFVLDRNARDQYINADTQQRYLGWLSCTTTLASKLFPDLEPRTAVQYMVYGFGEQDRYAAAVEAAVRADMGPGTEDDPTTCLMDGSKDAMKCCGPDGCQHR